MSKGKYKHIIWDWNGTIVDDATLCVEIVNEILEDRGLPQIMLANYREQFDFPVSKYYKRLGLPFNGPVFKEISTLFIDEYHSRWKQCQLQKNAKEIIVRISSMSIGQSLLSAGKQDHIEVFARYHELYDYFDAVVGTKNIYAEGKMLYGRRHVEALGLCSREHLLLIGDTLHDHEVAHALDADCILFARGHQSEQRLRQTDSTVIHQLDEILELL